MAELKNWSYATPFAQQIKAHARALYEDPSWFEHIDLFYSVLSSYGVHFFSPGCSVRRRLCCYLIAELGDRNDPILRRHRIWGHMHEPDVQAALRPFMEAITKRMDL